MHIASETNKGEIIPITHSAHRFVPCMLPTLFPTCFMNDDDDDGPHFFPDAGPTAIVTSHHAKGYSFAAECAASVQVNFGDMTKGNLIVPANCTQVISHGVSWAKKTEAWHTFWHWNKTLF